MRWEEMQQSDDVAAADWIRERLHPWAAHDVGSTVPTGFDAYVRIFHPSWKPHMVEVRWSEIAAANGRTVHPEMQFHSIAGHGAHDRGWYGPREGTLSPSQVRAMVPLLARHTSTPERCWLCVWEGYGYFTGGRAVAFLRAVDPNAPPPPPPPPAPPPRKLSRSRVRLPARDHVLFTGSVADAEGWEDGPNLWWPDDRAWCVASEIDFPYTYVGGPAALIEEILAHPALEALPATVQDGVTADSDRLNS